MNGRLALVLSAVVWTALAAAAALADELAKSGELLRPATQPAKRPARPAKPPEGVEPGRAGEPPDRGELKRELLVDQKTVVRFKGVHHSVCGGLTKLCPDECGASGDYATFEILAYLAYDKPGQWGDPKQKTLTVQVEDNRKSVTLPKAQAETIRGLKEGDHLRLDWRHDYVTRKWNDTTLTAPERPITRLETITREAAEKLVNDADARESEKKER